MICFFFYTF